MNKNISPYFKTRFNFLPKNGCYFTIELVNNFSCENFILLRREMCLSKEQKELEEIKIRNEV